MRALKSSFIAGPVSIPQRHTLRPLCCLAPPRRPPPKRSLSQNFLRDRAQISRIVETFTELHSQHPDTKVIEIGPGTGALTDLLYPQYPDMHAIEVDSRAIEYLTEQHPGLNVRHEDVLKVDWETYRKCCVVGNLPYHIVSQILLSLLETQPGTVKNCLLMMQKEVAARIVARPRTKSYGILSVITQLHGEPRLMFDVPPKAFVPVPKVTSSVVCIDMEKGYEKFDVWNVTLRRRLRTVLKAAFGQRRKMMRNSLRVLCEELGTELDERWCQKRAEEIEPGEFLDIVAQLFGEEGTGEDRKGEEGRGEWETVWRQ